jgi:sugar lactone lactonase YvrE
MHSLQRRFAFTLAFFALLAVAASRGFAQPPVYLAQWGSHGTGPGQFGYPSGVATDASGNVYVVDAYNYRIEKFTDTGVFLTQWGSLGSDDGQFEGPLGIAVDGDGNVYVTDQINGVQKFTGAGVFIGRWGRSGFGNGEFYYPFAIAADAAGSIYVADTYNSRVQKFTNTGVYLTQWGTLGSANGEFDVPQGIATDLSGNVFVGDAYNNRVQKFTNTGVYLAQWGSAGADTLADGRLDHPIGVATDSTGNVYVADVNNYRIQKFTGTGAFLTKWGEYGSGDGQFFDPLAVATHDGGLVYVVDSYNFRIQKFGPGTSTTIEIGLDFGPPVLNLSSHGLWITAYLEPVAPHTADEIDVPSIRLNGVVPVDPDAPSSLTDHDGDGVTELAVRFDRAAVELTLPEGDHVPVHVTGTIGDDAFVGTGELRVIRAHVSLPDSGQVVAGTMTEVRWDEPDGVTVQSVALLLSTDAGDTWTLVARDLPNTGRSQWAVPNVVTDQAKIAVVLIESGGSDGVEGILGVSKTFSIASPLGVPDGSVSFALRGVTPNPAPREMQVSFCLVSSRPASLGLFDVSGRQVEMRRVDDLGPGWHTVTFGGRVRLPDGLYFIRLMQDGWSLSTRVAVVR